MSPTNDGTHAGTHDPHDPHARFPQEEDTVNAPRVGAIGAASLIVFLLGIVWAWRIWEVGITEILPRGENPPATELGKREIGIVNQWILHPNVVTDDPRTDEKHLGGYGWIDRKQQIIHIPIDVAMKQVIQSAARSGNKTGDDAGGAR